MQSPGHAPLAHILRYWLFTMDLCYCMSVCLQMMLRWEQFSGSTLRLAELTWVVSIVISYFLSGLAAIKGNLLSFSRPNKVSIQLSCFAGLKAGTVWEETLFFDWANSSTPNRVSQSGVLGIAIPFNFVIQWEQFFLMESLISSRVVPIAWDIVPWDAYQLEADWEITRYRWNRCKQLYFFPD